ncbi:hypothetical protein KFL_013620020 [Klebsormidium nitens]|uniref:Uncharacterized protein n=1 Tax=Klebsormidium nitens TaxID=105231 RepID=A0A1Y1IR96_KLENI|nr:hypothetical protein KFL_013620020 [Klebsormidium nitens]|eukprot:GAQ93213.1 hypothetical protein KFL_013620020 [Klebsormidium nitens]
MNRHAKRAQRGKLREQQVSVQADGRFGGDAHGSAGVPVWGAECVPAASNRPQREGVRPSEPEKCMAKEKREGPLYEISRFRKRMRSKKDDEQEGGSDSDLPPLINGYDTDEEDEDRDSSDRAPSDSAIGCNPGLLDPSRRGPRVMGSPREASPMVPGGNGPSGAAEPITSQVPDQREYGLLAQESCVAPPSGRRVAISTARAAAPSSLTADSTYSFFAAAAATSCERRSAASKRLKPVLKLNSQVSTSIP